MSADPLRDLYKTLTGRGALPLEPDDPYYVPILQAAPDKDPILMLWQRLDLAESESVHLLTGFRGNGKSTELRRLKHLLENESGARVLLVNMLDYLLMTKPLELSDFVLSLMTALGQTVEREVGLKALTHGYWERLQRFLTSEVQLDLNLDLAGAGAPAKLGLKLKNEPDFKERVQQHLRGHLGRLIEDAQGYVVELVQAIRDKDKDPDLKVVLLVDSVEQIRGVGTEAGLVHDSVVNLFSGQAASLAFPQLHLVYTIPPFLMSLAQNLGRTLGRHPIVSWPNVHVRHRDGRSDEAGLDVMQTIIERRYAGWHEIVPGPTLRRLAGCVGGDIRDFFRLIGECAIVLRTVRLTRPEATLTDEMVRRVEDQLRNEFLPIADDDARWLARIHANKDAALPSTTDLPTLARFLDGNLIMNYLNGEPWFDIHPLLVAEISRPRPEQAGQ
jgi:energy-coupling factor transporter ATP-binding protein EcfA2